MRNLFYVFKRFLNYLFCNSFTTKEMNNFPRYKWSLRAPEQRGRRPSTTIHLPTGKNGAEHVTSCINSWQLMFNDEMFEIVLRYTNAEIVRQTSNEKYPENDKTYHQVTSTELNAFLGLLYFAGMNKIGHTNTCDLWSNLGPPIYPATMSQRRFRFLLSFLRFDDKATRHERRLVDKFAPIREIWDTLIDNCKKYYSVHQNCTIDEQLVSFRGRCSFRVYMRNKPHKYGIKILMMNDSATSYMINAMPYIGRVQTEITETVPAYYVKTLSTPIHGTGRNITCNNWFASVRVMENIKQNYNLTLVATIRQTQREIPSCFKEKMKADSMKVGHAHQNCLLSFAPKNNKIVLLISSLHKTVKMEENNKPDVINYYNATKGGTDTFDQLCGEYSTARGTRRWPLRMFFLQFWITQQSTVLYYTN